jgi:DNA modification methylase
MAKKAEKSPVSGTRIDWIPLAQLQAATRNPKRHSAEIGTSIGRFGYVEPIVLDERTGRIVAGHGRREALLAMRERGDAPPAGIRADGEEWLVPVLRGWASRSDAEAEAYLLASNKLTEAGGWDEGQLASLLKDLGEQGLVGVGFDDKEIRELLAAQDARTELLADPDDVPAEPEAGAVYVKAGELWLLGKHRLLCGDSTKDEDVARLMAGVRAGLMNTDPPYGVAYANDDRPNPGVAKPRVAKPRVANDDLTGAELRALLDGAFGEAAAQALKEDSAWYLWHAPAIRELFDALDAVDFHLSRQIIWVKPVLLLGRGQYHNKHEPCLFGWRHVQPPDYGEGNGERTQTTVWEIAGVSQAERKEFNHSTPKPVALFEIPIVKHLMPGEIAYEPFAGSGPQIIAAEKTGRRCFAMELEPRYVQVAIERWERCTGKKAERG